MTFWLAFGLLCSLSLNAGLIALLYRSRRRGSALADGWTMTYANSPLLRRPYSPREMQELAELDALIASLGASGMPRSTPTFWDANLPPRP